MELNWIVTSMSKNRCLAARLAVSVWVSTDVLLYEFTEVSQIPYPKMSADSILDSLVNNLLLQNCQKQ